LNEIFWYEAGLGFCFAQGMFFKSKASTLDCVGAFFCYSISIFDFLFFLRYSKRARPARAYQDTARLVATNN